MKYNWNQELDEIFIKVPVSKDIETSDVTVKIIGLKIHIKVKEETILEGELLHRADLGSLWWIINDENEVEISFSKNNKRWWESLLVGSDEIDVNELVNNKETNFEDLDDEAKKVVEKMMVNNNNKTDK